MKKLIFIFFLLNILTINAQISFEKGYFITNSGTRMECYIKNLEWKNNPVDFLYKLQSGDSNTATGTIANVSEFGIDNGSKFKRSSVDIDLSSDDANKLTKEKNPTFKKMILFLNELAAGQAHLYKYQDGPLTKYFYETKAHPIEQLIHIRYLTATGDAAENNLFRQQLLNNVTNDRMALSDVKDLKYTEKALVQYFEKYNDSKSVKTVASENKAPTKPFHFSVVAGVGNASLTIDGPPVSFGLISVSLKKQIIKAGLEFEYTLPFNKNTWSVFVNPMYQKFSADKDFTIKDLYGNPTPNTVAVDYSSIELPVGVRYYVFLNPVSKIHFDAAFVIDIENYSHIVFNNKPSDTYNIKTGSNIAIGAGFDYKRLGLSLKYNTARQIMTGYVNWETKYSTAALALRYRFLDL